MPKANLLLVVTKLELGGAQKNVLDLAAGIDRSRFSISIFTAREGELMADALALPGISVRRSRFLERAVNPLKDLCALLELWVFIRRRRIQLVHTHSSKAGIIGRMAAALAGVRCVCHTVHGWSFNDRQSAAGRFFRVAAEKMVCGATRRFIVASRHDREKGIAYGLGSAADYAVIRYGIRRKDFGRGRAAGAQDETAPVIGTVACLKPQKAPQDFVRLAGLVCREFPRARFVLAGDGILRRDIARLIRRQGLDGNFVLAGWRRDIPEFLAGLDIFCLTSLWEGLPIAVIEAMASSLPVVCTDTGGVRELVDDGANGFIVPPGDMEAMAAVIVRLIKDKGLREAMGRKAAALPEEYDAAAMVRRTEQVYTDLLAA